MNYRRAKLIQAAFDKGYRYNTHNPDPAILSGYVVDGGLLIISRFPIVTSQFYEFKVAAVMSDCMALKGALYARIQIQNEFVNLITTHTQASYFDSSLHLFCESYLCRYQQLVELKDFVHSLHPEGLCIILGDLNQNASADKMSEVATFVDLVARSDVYNNKDKQTYKWLIQNEYEALVKALSSDSWQLIDCLRTSE